MIKGLSVVGEHEVETPAASGRRYESLLRRSSVMSLLHR